MTRFMTRVELRGSPTAKDYESLHAKMEAKGFERTIKGSDGKTYKLPHAMYYVESNLTVEQVRDHAADAAKSVWTSYAITTSEAPNTAWTGLEVA
jgi:hypothetical protein